MFRIMLRYHLDPARAAELLTKCQNQNIMSPSSTGYPSTKEINEPDRCTYDTIYKPVKNPIEL